MFEQARYVQNSFNITFPRTVYIRRKANEFEDLLKDKLTGHYSFPQVIPVPDDLDPEVPRIIFGSTHGFSQIVISQISIGLNVSHSPDWQLDGSKGQNYLRERVPILFEILKTIDSVSPYFCGLTTRVLLTTEAHDEVILSHLSDIFLKEKALEKTHDILVKITQVISERFFSNLMVQNYREWKLLEPQQGISRLSRKNSSIRGLLIEGDFNDRYSFNEQSNYFSTSTVALEIIDYAFKEIEKMVVKVRGESI